jgi:hypothetical protein
MWQPLCDRHGNVPCRDEEPSMLRRSDVERGSYAVFTDVLARQNSQPLHDIARRSLRHAMTARGNSHRPLPKDVCCLSHSSNVSISWPRLTGPEARRHRLEHPLTIPSHLVGLRASHPTQARGRYPAFIDGTADVSGCGVHRPRPLLGVTPRSARG